MTEPWDRPQVQAQEEAKAPPALPMGAAKTQPRQTLVEEGTVFKGVMSSNCPIVVRGRIEGELEGPSLHVSDSGTVAGVVKVTEIRSEGILSGEFDAERVQLSGQVRDKTVIRAKSLEVKLAPETGRMEVVFGECALEVGEVPTRSAAIEETLKGDSATDPTGGNGAAEAVEGQDASGEDENEQDGSSRRRKRGERRRRHQA